MRKNLKYLLLLFAAVFFFSTCKKSSNDTTTPPAPVASFTASFTVSNFAPAQVYFSNTSTNAATAHWNFGDGNQTDTFSLSHTYYSGGNFTVTLTVTGTNSGTSTTSQTVSILNTPTTAKISSITLAQFPSRDSAGNYWDAGNGLPDIYFKLFHDTTVVANYDSLVYSNVSGTSLTINLSTPYVIGSLTDTMYVAAFDKEAAPPDSLIGKGHAPKQGFRMSDYTTTHPSSINIASAPDSLKFTLGITWQ